MSKKVIGLAGEAGTGKDTFAAPLIKRGFVQVEFARNLKNMCKEVFNLTGAMVDTQAGKAKSFDVPRTFTQRHLTHILKFMGKTHEIRFDDDRLQQLQREHIQLHLRRTGSPVTFRTPREVLQFIGTDVCRALIPTYHTDVACKLIREAVSPVVVTDVRFPNEREVLKDNFNATLVRIKRPGHTPNYSTITGNEEETEVAVTSDVPVHASETSFGADTDYDLVILNDKKIEDLQTESLIFI